MRALARASSGFLLVAAISWAFASSLTSCGTSDTGPQVPHNQLLSAAACETCAVEQGNVTCWGQLTPSLKPPTPLPAGSTPTKVVLPGPVTILAVGPEQVCAALDQEAGVYCWGLNDVGQLGVTVSTTDPTAIVATPVKTDFSSSAKAIVAGEGFTCVLDSTGAVKCTGGRVDGTLGNGPKVMSAIPIAVPSIGNITAIAGGQRHVCSLDNNGVVACWGSNHLGQCGQKGDDTEEFAAVVPIAAADKIWSGANTACAHTTAGEVWCWGDNANGVEGDTTGDTSPRKVALDKYSTLALGAESACGIDASGNVDCWGQEIAVKPTQVLAPTPVLDLTKPNVLVSGASHHCAWSGGLVYCWGQNDCGQTGLVGPFIATPTSVTL